MFFGIEAAVILFKLSPRKYTPLEVYEKETKKPEQVNADYLPLLKKGTKSDKKNLNTE